MRTILWLVVVCAILAPSTVDAQRRRWDRRRPFVPVVTHSITIDTPTSNASFTSATTPLTISGTASSVSADHVVWSNDRGGSGTASGVTAWAITASAGATTVFSDSMSCATTQALTAQTPQIGTGYTEVVDTAGTVTLTCTPVGYGYPDSTPVAGSVVINTITPSPALSGTDFDFSVKVAGGPGSNKRWGMVYRYSDANNYCAVVVRSGTYNPDLYWVKKQAGVFSDLHTAINGDHISGGAIRLVRTGSTVELFDTGVSKGTSSDAFCNANVTLGIGAGALGGVSTDTMGTDVRFDDVTVIDPGGGSSGVTLQSGVNVITVTLKDASDVTLATDTIRVTYGVTDTTPPSASLHTPTPNPTYAVASASLLVAGTLTDNTGVTAGTFTCSAASGSCSPASGSLDGTFGGTSVEASKTFTLSCAAAPGVLNTITFTPADAAGNTPVTDAIGVTCTTSDSTPPVPVISTNGGSNFSTTNTTTALAGSATDVGSGLDRIDVECSTCTPTITTAVGTNPWSLASLGLGAGANLVTVRAYDLAGNTGTDTITITRTVALSITSSSPLSSVAQNVAMTGQTLTATGGTSPYTWDNNSGGTSLGGAACTGLSISSVGVVSGTPTTLGTCSFTAKVTDTVAATATKAMQITVVASAKGGNDFFESGIADAKFFKAISLRPTGGVNCTDTYMGISFAAGDRSLGTCNPYFAAQLDDTLSSTLRYAYPPTVMDTSGVPTPHVAYDATVGGSLIELPIYTTPITAPTSLSVSLPSGAPNAGQECETGAPSDCIVMKVSVVGSNSTWGNNRSFRVDNELFMCEAVIGFDTANPTSKVCRRTTDSGTKQELRVRRAQNGTTAAAHTASTTTYVGVHTPGGSQQLRLPLKTTDGHTYLIIQDIRFNDAWVGVVGNSGNKFFQLSSVGGGDERLFETKIQYQGNTGLASGALCSNNGTLFNKATMIAALDARSYNSIASGPNVAWTDTNGNTMGDNVTSVDLLKPQLASFCIVPNRWMRLFWYIDQRANDYDLISLWVGDEVATPVQMFSGLEFSVRPDAGALTCVTSSGCRLDKLWIEQNDTYPSHDLGNVDQFRLRKIWLRNMLVLRDVDPSTIATPGAGWLLKPLP